MVVVEERGNPAGLRQAPRERRSTWERGRAAPELVVRLPSHPPHIYRGKGEGGRPPQIQSEEGAAAKGGRSASQVKWRPSPLGFPLSHADGPWGAWCPWPIKARAPPYSPCYCIGRGGTISGPPDPSGILRNLLEASRYNTKKTRTFPATKTRLPIYKSLPPDHSGTPRDVRDLIRDSEQHSVTTYKLPL